MGQHHSPYLAMSNNPVSSIDPNGGYDVNNGINIDAAWGRDNAEIEAFMMGGGMKDQQSFDSWMSSFERQETAAMEMGNYLDHRAKYYNSKLGEWGRKRTSIRTGDYWEADPSLKMDNPRSRFSFSTNWIGNSISGASNPTETRNSWGYSYYYKGPGVGEYKWKFDEESFFNDKGKTNLGQIFRVFDEGAKESTINYAVNDFLSVGIGQAHFKQEFQVGGGDYVLDNNGTTIVGVNIAVTKKFNNNYPVAKFINIRVSALIGPTVSQPVLKNGNNKIAEACFGRVGVGATMGISPIVNLTKNWSVFVKGSVNFTTYKANFGSNGTYQNNTIGVGIGSGIIFKYFVQPYEDEINKIFNKPPFIFKFK